MARNSDAYRRYDRTETARDRGKKHTGKHILVEGGELRAEGCELCLPARRAELIAEREMVQAMMPVVNEDGGR